MKLLPVAWLKSWTPPAQVKLRYSSDEQPGIARLKHRSFFIYRDAKHKPVKNKTTHGDSHVGDSTGLN